jgi:hypothetical protein
MSQPPGRRHYTLGQLIGAAALAAIAVGTAANPTLMRGILFTLIPLAILVLGPLLVIQQLAEGAFGRDCPNCGSRGMERRSVMSFGGRFHACRECGARYRRGLVGFWEDASGPEYDAHFARPAASDPWNAPPSLEDEDLIYSKTHVNLVHAKRRRNPNNPNGPGLE